MKSAFIVVVTLLLVVDFMLRARDVNKEKDFASLVALSFNGVMVVWGVAAFFA